MRTASVAIPVVVLLAIWEFLTFSLPGPHGDPNLAWIVLSHVLFDVATVLAVVVGGFAGLRRLPSGVRVSAGTGVVIALCYLISSFLVLAVLPHSGLWLVVAFLVLTAIAFGLTRLLARFLARRST